MMADNLAHSNQRGVLTFNDLPDEVLIEIFDFYVVRFHDLGFHAFRDYDAKEKIESWQTLVHVCRRWRGLVFGSPRRLNLQLYYDPQRVERRATKTLDIWPPLPLFIRDAALGTSVDNVIAELEHSHRIYHINIDFYATEQIEKLWRAMQVPFPELTYLRLSLNTPYYDTPYPPLLPDSFLGGSAPRLRFLEWDSIPSPGLPNLLFSAIHLVELRLCNIPPFGYISAEAMATCLPMLTSLKTFRLQFRVESPQSFPDQENRRLPPPTRFILPVLTTFEFEGVNKYLEELVAGIDTPQLSRFSTEFLNDIEFHTPELTQFISRTPTLGGYDEACLSFDSRGAQVSLAHCDFKRILEIKISCPEPDRQLSALAKICTLSLSRCLLLTMENLYVNGWWSPFIPQSPTVEWLDILLPFTAVKNLHIATAFLIAFAVGLKHTGERATEVLPSLQSIFLDPSIASEHVPEGIAQFISTRQLTNRPVTISPWEF